jgi:hypothetical protein
VRSIRATMLATVTMVAMTNAFAQQEEGLGKLSFPTSCDPKVQAEFERGVAMLHSYWFTVARRTFEGVLREDPNCAMAHWGVAMDILGNMFVAPPTRDGANAAWAELEKARATSPQTDRERDWIEALSAYYRDHEKTPVDVRLVAYRTGWLRAIRTISRSRHTMPSRCRRPHLPPTRPTPTSSSLWRSWRSCTSKTRCIRA